MKISSSLLEKRHNIQSYGYHLGLATYESQCPYMARLLFVFTNPRSNAAEEQVFSMVIKIEFRDNL